MVHRIGRSARVVATITATALAVAGCSSDDSASDASFLEGRQTVTVYRQGVSDDFDPEAFLLNLADMFDIQGAPTRSEDGDYISARSPRRPSTRPATVSMDLQRFTWKYTSETFSTDRKCERCEPSTITAEDALARAEELFAATGADTLTGEDQWEIVGEEATGEDPDGPFTTVTMHRVFHGHQLKPTYVWYFGNGDEVLAVSGEVWHPIPVGDVGLLTPAEAYDQGATLEFTDSYDLELASIEDAELRYTTVFVRSTGVGFIVPTYRFSPSAEVFAIRDEDWPE